MNAAQQAYLVKHRKTGQFFTGFDKECVPQWGEWSRAKRFSKLMAEMQALLLRRTDAAVQIKPVDLSAAA